MSNVMNVSNEMICSLDALLNTFHLLSRIVRVKIHNAKHIATASQSVCKNGLEKQKITTSYALIPLRKIYNV